MKGEGCDYFNLVLGIRRLFWVTEQYDNDRNHIQLTRHGAVQPECSTWPHALAP